MQIGNSDSYYIKQYKGRREWEREGQVRERENSYFRSSATRLRKKTEITKGKMLSLGWLKAFNVFACVGAY